jgi:AAA domain
MGAHGDSEGRGDVLAFWRVVELFSPQQVPRLEEERVCRVAEEDGDWDEEVLLPWQAGHRLGGASLREGNAWQHHVYVGVYSLDGAFAELRAALAGGEEEEGELPRAGDSALAAFTVASDGRVILGSQTLSSCAWALSRASGGEVGSREWLAGFEHEARVFADEFARLLALGEEDLEGNELARAGHSVGAILDLELLGEVQELLAEVLGVADADADADDRQDGESGGRGARVIRQALEVRVSSRQIKRANRYRALELDFLNSFIARDLGKVAAAVDEGAFGTALERYLAAAAGVAPARDLGRVDVERDLNRVRELLAPGLLPAGRWPRAVAEPADLGQQLAVNTIIHGGYFEQDGGGLLAVNGPPGTGKTTMLRDLIAALVVERARALAELRKPEDAFAAQPFKFGAGSSARTVHRLKDQFTGFEIVLACATNAAAENVTVEIPDVQAIAAEWRGRLDYFNDIASSVLDGVRPHGERADRESRGEEPREAWGMLAARLGSVARCQSFATAFWFGQRQESAGPGASSSGDRWGGASGREWRPGLLQVLKSHRDEPGEWRDAVRDFRAALDRERDIRAQREGCADLFTQLAAYQRTVQEHAAELPEAQAKLRRTNAALNPERAGRSRCERERELCAQALARHRAARPRLLEVLPSLGRSLRDWRARDYQLAGRLNAAERALAHATGSCADIERNIAAATAQVRRHEDGESFARERLRELEGEIAAAESRWQELFPGCVFPGERWAQDSHRAERELRAPWVDEAWEGARTEVLLAALGLHKAFVLGAARKLMPSVGVAIDVIQGASRYEVPPEAALAAWQCLFMLVPVVSTTFASYPRLFRHLGQEDLGWLFIDEAAQSTPQNAVGAIWRSRHAVVVGDPLQLEPIVTLPLGAQWDLLEAHGVPRELLPAHCSVQTLADRLAPVGTHRGGDGQEWVGSPLTVHRRCEQPMFAIVNKIAYDGQMIAHTPGRPELALPASSWLHVAGQRSGGRHWVAEEGVVLERLLSELERFGVDLAEVFLIAPFRDVASQLARYRRSYPGITAGTIHTTQGKEADVVILVLGGDPGRRGDKRWASQRPNLLNVAISRARRRLYVIGNRQDWGELPYFQVLAGGLEAGD